MLCAHHKLTLCSEHTFIKRFPKLILLHFVLPVSGLVEICYCCWCHSNWGFPFYFYTGSILTQQGFLVTVFHCGNLERQWLKALTLCGGAEVLCLWQGLHPQGEEVSLSAWCQNIDQCKRDEPWAQSEPEFISHMREKADQKQTLWRQGSSL